MENFEKKKKCSKFTGSHEARRVKKKYFKTPGTLLYVCLEAKIFSSLLFIHFIILYRFYPNYNSFRFRE